jgi:hypothetical protein
MNTDKAGKEGKCEEEPERCDGCAYTHQTKMCVVRGESHLHFCFYCMGRGSTYIDFAFLKKRNK